MTRAGKRRPRSNSQIPSRKPQLPIRALFLDVDGVLTDGQIYLDGRGHELKVFNTKDGHGMRKATAAGITLCWVSGRSSPATASRARELGVPLCYQGVRNKRARLEAVRRKLGLTREETASIGDDEADIPMFEATGFSACPADAVPAARKAAAVVLKSRGGRGAVREFIELILRRNGRP